MSRQMIHLGRPDDALELIHLAQYGSRECATPRTQAMLYAMEARAYANMGQPSKCKRAVRMAEDTFAEAGLDGEPEPDWIRFFSAAELNGENGHSFRDLAYAAGRSPTYASLAEPVLRRSRRALRQGRRAPAFVRPQPRRYGHRPSAEEGARGICPPRNSGADHCHAGALRAGQHQAP